MALLAQRRDNAVTHALHERKPHSSVVNGPLDACVSVGEKDSVWNRMHFSRYSGCNLICDLMMFTMTFTLWLNCLVVTLAEDVLLCFSSCSSRVASEN